VHDAGVLEIDDATGSSASHVRRVAVPTLASLGPLRLGMVRLDSAHAARRDADGALWYVLSPPSQ
jgi:hypothetical protein